MPKHINDGRWHSNDDIASFRLTNIEGLLEDLNNKIDLMIVATASRRKSWIARLFSRSWRGPDPNGKPISHENPHDTDWTRFVWEDAK